MDFIKSYQTDYSDFKKRAKAAGLSVIDSKNIWRYLLGSNKYLKHKALKQIKKLNIQIRDLTTLRAALK